MSPGTKLIRNAAILSGAGSLVAETLWARALGLVIGSTVEAAALTFAAFIAGLAAGSYLIGRRADGLARPLPAYALLEIVIAVIAVAAGMVLFWLRLYPFGDASATAVASVAALVVVTIPSAAIGGTLPLMMVGARSLGEPVATLAPLYGANVLGAACGAMLVSFVLLPNLGFTGSVLAGASLHVASALFAWRAAARARPESARDAVESEPPSEGPEPGPIVPVDSLAALLLLAGVSGFAVLALEVVWFRLATFFFGNRTYALSIILATVLVHLSIGAWLCPRFLRRWSPRGHVFLGGMTLAAAVMSLLSLWVGEWWIARSEEILLVRSRSPLVPLLFVLQPFVLMAPSMIALGTLFPSSIVLARRSYQRPGESVGLFYVVNTVGSVLGSLGAGFIGIAYFGTLRTGSMIVGAMAVVSALFFLAAKSSRDRVLGVGGGFACAGAAFLVLPATLDANLPVENEIVARYEDEHAVVTVRRIHDPQLPPEARPATILLANRQAEVHPLEMHATRRCQQLQAYLGSWHRPGASRVLNIGIGYGITAGAFGLFEGTEVDAVEVLPGVVDAAHHFSPYNFDYRDNPRIRVVIDDGRRFLASTQARYDIISVNMTLPELPSGSSLYSSEFYELVQSRLTADGLLVQHVHGSDKPAIVTTLAHAFPTHLVYPCYWDTATSGAGPFADEALQSQLAAGSMSLVVVATGGTLAPLHWGDVEPRLPPQVIGEIRAIGLAPLLADGSLLSVPGRLTHLQADLWEGSIVTDDNALLEFSLSTPSPLFGW